MQHSGNNKHGSTNIAAGPRFSGPAVFDGEPDITRYNIWSFTA